MGPGGRTRAGPAGAPGLDAARHPAAPAAHAGQVWAQRVRRGRRVRDLHLRLPFV